MCSRVRTLSEGAASRLAGSLSGVMAEKLVLGAEAVYFSVTLPYELFKGRW